MTTNLVVVPGIGGERAEALVEHGIETLEQLASASVDRIAAVPGFGPVTARRSKQTAQELLLSSRKKAGAATGEPEEKKPESGRKARKKDRKGKARRKDGSKGKTRDKKSKKRDEKRKKKKKDKKKKKGRSSGKGKRKDKGS